MNQDQLVSIKVGSVVSCEDSIAAAIITQVGDGPHQGQFILRWETGRETIEDLLQDSWKLHPAMPERGIDRQVFVILKELYDGQELADARDVAHRLLTRKDAAACDASILLRRLLEGDDTTGFNLAVEALIEKHSFA